MRSTCSHCGAALPPTMTGLPAAGAPPTGVPVTGPVGIAVIGAPPVTGTPVTTPPVVGPTGVTITGAPPVTGVAITGPAAITGVPGLVVVIPPAATGVVDHPTPCCPLACTPEPMTTACTLAAAGALVVDLPEFDA